MKLVVNHRSNEGVYKAAHCLEIVRVLASDSPSRSRDNTYLQLLVLPDFSVSRLGSHRCPKALSEKKLYNRLWRLGYLPWKILVAGDKKNSG